MNLTVIIGQGTLGRMAAETCHHSQQEGTNAPRKRQTRYRLVPQAHNDRYVDGSEPHIARETIEYPSHEGLLAREACHLSIGRVTEVGKHQQDDTTEVMAPVGEVEHPPGTDAQEDGEDGNGIGMDTQPIPQQGKNQADGTREVDIQPLLRVLRLKR